MNWWSTYEELHISLTEDRSELDLLDWTRTVSELCLVQLSGAHFIVVSIHRRAGYNSIVVVVVVIVVVVVGVA